MYTDPSKISESRGDKVTPFPVFTPPPGASPVK
jgi:hypothetical protein